MVAELIADECANNSANDGTGNGRTVIAVHSDIGLIRIVNDNGCGRNDDHFLRVVPTIIIVGAVITVIPVGFMNINILFHDGGWVIIMMIPRSYNRCGRMRSWMLVMGDRVCGGMRRFMRDRLRRIFRVGVVMIVTRVITILMILGKGRCCKTCGQQSGK